jgi:hypothetical protein
VEDLEGPCSASLHDFIVTKDFKALTTSLEENGAELYVSLPPKGTEFDFSMFIIQPQANTDFSPTKSRIEKLFATHKVRKNLQQVPFKHPVRAESYASLNTSQPYDTFQHFNSKLLAPGGLPQSTENAGQRFPASELSFGSESRPFAPEHNNFGLFSSGPQGSSHNIRQLFDETKSARNSSVSVIGGRSSLVQMFLYSSEASQIQMSFYNRVLLDFIELL